MEALESPADKDAGEDHTRTPLYCIGFAALISQLFQYLRQDLFDFTDRFISDFTLTDSISPDDNNE